MARRTFQKREHPGVIARRNRAWLSAMVPAEQRERFEQDFKVESLPALPKTRGPRVDHEDLEKHVLASVGDLLRIHPRALLVVRQNTGSLPYESGGRAVPLWFYKLLRKPHELTITDYWGFLQDGKPFAFECKRPSWKWSGSDREVKQRGFIQMIESFGGLGRFVTDAEQVNEALT